MFKKARYACLVLLFCLTTLPPAFARQDLSPTEPGSTPRFNPNCSLLDNPGVRARMSGAFEMALLEACGRAVPGPALPAGRPVPAAVQQGGPDIRVNAVDPLVSSTTQSETSIAINPNTGTICSTYNDSYHYHIQGQGYIGFSRSVDGGASFQDGGVMPPAGGGRSRGDPSVVWRASNGRFYFTCIHENTSSGAYGLGLWQSTDDCATFQWVGMVHAGYSDDKEFMAVDNTPSSPYYGRLYVAWTDFAAFGRIGVVHSDDGVTWSAPVYITTDYESVQGAWPAVAPDGDVYVAWLRWTAGELMTFDVARSTNGGTSFTRLTNPPRSSVTVPRDLAASQQCGRDALRGRIRYLPSPQIVIGPDGCLHVAYSYDPDGQDIGDVVNSYYRRSCDHGTTWGPEVLLNDDATLTDQFFPNVAVNANNIVGASWYDRRLDTAGNYYFDRYRAVSRDGGVTWEANERVSDVSSPVYINPATSACYHGDYDQLGLDAGSLYVQWSDDRVFFNEHDDPDIWFERQSLTSDFTLTVTPDVHQLCRPSVVTSTVGVGVMGTYTQPVTLSDGGLPVGVSTAFSANPITPLPGTAIYTVTVAAGAVDGTYDWAVSGSGSGLTHTVTVSLSIEGVFPADTDFAWEPVTPTVGAVVTFTAETTGTEPLAFAWTWGDGEASNGQVVTHTYTQSGSYTVVLTATNPCGQEALTREITVAAPPPVYRIYLPLLLRTGG
jgi:PKD domain